MSDVSTSLADAISPGSAPSPAPTPAPASAPAPAPEPVTPTPPQPPAAGNVNPYVPPAPPPQNLQTAAPEPPAPGPGQPPQPPAQTQGEQPQQPQIPQEYMQAHEWRGQIEKEAQALGGLDNVPMALKWTRTLFGLEPPPDGVSPAAHFMNELWHADRQVYLAMLGAVANEHADRLLDHLDDRFFAKHEIPKDRLGDIKDFLRYGRVSATDAAQREFVSLLKPELQTIFARLKPAQQAFYVDQVDRGIMSLEFAEQEIAEKGILQLIDGERSQAKEREAEAANLAAEQRARDRANQEIARYENVYVEAQARKHGVDAEIVRDWVARAAAELDLAAQMDPQHPAKKAWDNLQEACASGNEMRIKPAMNQLQILVERQVDDLLARRSGKAPAPAPTNGHQPPGQPPGQTTSLRQPQQPQFEPTNPNAPADWSNVSLDDYLFGRANPAGA